MKQLNASTGRKNESIAKAVNKTRIQLYDEKVCVFPG
jgi:hypothetical protein